MKSNSLRCLDIALYSLFVFMLGVHSAKADTSSFSFNNKLRYGVGREDYFGEKKQKDYLEEEMNFQMTWKNFLAGGRYEYDNPAEFGYDHNKLKKYFLEYRKGPWRLRTGTFSALFSRGMVLNAHEEKPIGHDSEIAGINIKYETEKSLVHLVGGTLDYEQIPDFENIIKYRIRGGSVRRKFAEYLNIGGSYLTSKVSQEIGFYRIIDVFDMNLAEIWTEFQFEKLQLYFNAASNSQKGNELFVKGKNSVYIGLNYFPGKSGITIEYKNYKYGIASPKSWDYTLRHDRLLAFQNPPTVVKEHS